MEEVTLTAIIRRKGGREGGREGGRGREGEEGRGRVGERGREGGREEREGERGGGRREREGGRRERERGRERREGISPDGGQLTACSVTALESNLTDAGSGLSLAFSKLGSVSGKSDMVAV